MQLSFDYITILAWAPVSTPVIAFITIGNTPIRPAKNTIHCVELGGLDFLRPALGHHYPVVTNKFLAHAFLNRYAYRKQHISSW